LNVGLHKNGKKWDPEANLTEQELFLQQELLEEQLLEDLLVVGWVEVVDRVSDDGLIDWDGGDEGDGQDDEECL
jgi:hypothetical protein